MALVRVFCQALGGRPAEELRKTSDALASLPLHLQLAILEHTTRQDSMRFLCQLWGHDEQRWTSLLTTRRWDETLFPDAPEPTWLVTSSAVAGLLMSPSGNGVFYTFGGSYVIAHGPGSARSVLRLEHPPASGVLGAHGTELWLRSAKSCAYRVRCVGGLEHLATCPWYNAGSDERALIAEDDMGLPVGITRHQYNFIAVRPLLWPNAEHQQRRTSRFHHSHPAGGHLLFMTGHGQWLAWCPTKREVWIAPLASPDHQARLLFSSAEAIYDDDHANLGDEEPYTLLQATLTIGGPRYAERLFIGDTWGRVHWWTGLSDVTPMHGVLHTHLALPRRIWVRHRDGAMLHIA